MCLVSDGIFWRIISNFSVNLWSMNGMNWMNDEWMNGLKSVSDKKDFEILVRNVNLKGPPPLKWWRSFQIHVPYQNLKVLFIWHRLYVLYIVLHVWTQKILKFHSSKSLTSDNTFVVRDNVTTKGERKKTRPPTLLESSYLWYIQNKVVFHNNIFKKHVLCTLSLNLNGDLSRLFINTFVFALLLQSQQSFFF